MNITLSDGKPCEVERMGIFGMDGVGPELAGPFRYKMTLASGEEVEDIYDPRRYSNPPQLPDVKSEVIEHTPTWYALLEWQTYKAALTHEVVKRIPSVVEYVKVVSRHILNTCVKPEDHNRIVEDSDWIAVVKAALVPQVTRQVLAETFTKHFAAHYNGQDVLDAIQSIEKGRGGYDAIRVWEIEAMGPLSEAEWALRPLDERARRVAARALPDLLKSLETDRAIKEARRNAKQH